MMDVSRNEWLGRRCGEGVDSRRMAPSERRSACENPTSLNRYLRVLFPIRTELSAKVTEIDIPTNTSDLNKVK